MYKLTFNTFKQSSQFLFPIIELNLTQQIPVQDYHLQCVNHAAVIHKGPSRRFAILKGNARAKTNFTARSVTIETA